MKMKNLLLANILTVIGQLVSFVASTRKEKKQILLVQILAMLIMSAGSLLLKGYSAMVMDGLAILRNVFSIYSISFKGMSQLFIVLAIVLGVYFNNLGFLGMFPIFSNVAISLVYLNKNASTKMIQLVSAFGCVCWVIYDLAIGAYAGMFLDTVNAISYVYNALDRKEKVKS